MLLVEGSYNRRNKGISDAIDCWILSVRKLGVRVCTDIRRDGWRVRMASRMAAYEDEGGAAIKTNERTIWSLAKFENNR